MNTPSQDSLPDLEPADWRLTRSLFDKLLDASEADRDALLAPYAEDDPVRRAAERLVRALADVGGFMDTDDAEGAANEAAPAELPSDVVTGYDLRERLGEGAFGVVYRARQLEPIERDVAIKLLRPGFVSPQVLSRFWGEHGYLAQVDHPDVVKVLDAGTTADGRSYIVMELIRGEPITTFATERGLSIEDRIRLMVRVCRAVQAIHQSAIIHRDLKPTNILVSDHDGSPRPRVIDFGVATAIDAAERSGWTCIGQPIGTPRYASPEQSSSTAAIGTRADVYALGVVLCELLTGRRPREDASGVASRQARSPSQLSRVESEARKLRGDLDRIVLKAVAWDADLRYCSAAELADDIERFLAGLPVRATPPGTLYVLRKFVRRHRIAVTAASAAMLVLVSALVLSVRAERAAEAARAVALAEAERAEAFTAFVLSDMVAAVDPTMNFAVDRDPTVADLLQAIEASAPSWRPGDVRARFDLLAHAAVAHAELRNRDNAARLAAAALDVARSLDDPPADRLIKLEHTLLDARRDLSESERAETRRALLSRAEAEIGPDHRLTRRLELSVASDLNAPEDRLAIYTRLAEEAEEPLLRHDAWRANADILERLGRTSEEIEARLRVLELAERLDAFATTRPLGARYRLAVALGRDGQPDAALDVLQPLLSVDDSEVPPHHPGRVASAFLAVRLAQNAGRANEAVSIAQEVAATQEAHFGEASLEHAMAMTVLARSLRATGRPTEALPIYDRAIEIRTRILGENDPELGQIVAERNDLRAANDRP